jgi:DNA-binding GntR family transcriptional regulator
VERPPQRRVLRDDIKERIIERILDGTYPAGVRIVESQLAHEFGTSQSPVREALRDLEGMRFIESQPHVGARVRAVTPEELGQIYPVRAALEEIAGREAAPRISNDVLAELGEQLAAMRRAADAGDVHEQLVHDARFHEVIVEASGNQILLEVWRSLHVEARTLISVIKSDSNLRMIAEMHRPVLHALQYRDAELASKEMRAHIEFFGSFVTDRRPKTD